MKTFSSASLASPASAVNLHHYGRSLSVPNDQYSVKRQLSNNIDEDSKKQLKQNGAGDLGKLEFVKVDVDNNMVRNEKVAVEISTIFTIGIGADRPEKPV